jgi:thiamine pyrophosphate-dependent acetolactate synthase large subunit-like protein
MAETAWCAPKPSAVRVMHTARLDNAELGKISREQISAIRPVWQTDLVNPDFAAYAESCGGRGFRVSSADELRRCWRWRSR